MSIFSAIFLRKPRYQVSAYRDLYTAIVSRLTRSGVYVGGTANYPRVEVHSFREQERLDKEGAIRQVTFTVESMSNTSLAEAVTMNEDNLRLLSQADLDIEGWGPLAVLPVQLQDLTETTDSKKIIYRILQECSVYIEKIKTDEPDEDEEEIDNGNT